ITLPQPLTQNGSHVYSAQSKNCPPDPEVGRIVWECFFNECTIVVGNVKGGLSPTPEREIAGLLFEATFDLMHES
ncbi:MAG: hypothetical protein LAT76_09425, partial [Schleiferiaceae bacterium]|nr:hypothetical protein [Schleiferiaceae bacterium]